jgi:hypothetical protein
MPAKKATRASVKKQEEPEEQSEPEPSAKKRRQNGPKVIS